jgi:crossover junction endonuclease MUS81
MPAETECANPLLLGWLKEWMDQANERGSKGALTYKKAWQAMKACPIAFSHPGEAIQLKGLGPKLCTRLAENLKEYCDKNGLPMPEPPYKAKKRTSGEDLPEGEAAAAKKPKKTKPYVPALRSGPYAILLALSTLEEDSAGGLTKAEIIEIAQPNCDSSFTAPGDPSGFHTAWSSMKTLKNKDLIDERGRPTKKYALTEDGWEVVRKMKVVIEALRKGPISKSTTATAAPQAAPKAPATSNGPLASATGSSRTLGGTAAGGVRADDNVQRRIQGRTTVETINLDDSPQIRRSVAITASTERRTETTASRNTSGDILRDFVDEQATTMQTHSRQWQKIDTHRPPSTNIRLDAYRQSSRTTSFTRQISDGEYVEILSSPAIISNSRKRLEKPPAPILQPRVPATAPPAPFSRAQNYMLPDEESSRAMRPPVVPAMPDQPTTTFPTIDPIYVPPEAYTVELIVDTREKQSRSNPDYFQDMLSRLGVQSETRALDVGDALWVARIHDPTLLSDHGEEGTDILLDYIVERKRLDDLIGSIKDGRFQEQKFRLRRSGVQNVIYLVEEMKLAVETESKYHEAMNSSVAGTAVLNGYFVRRTKKVDDTIRYLARMTKLLRQEYAGKPLYIIPSKHLAPLTYLPLLSHLQKTQPHRTHNITFSSFAALSSKSDSLTLKDVFLKMLMCTRGITGAKALEIQRHWQTPAAFVEALKGCEEGCNEVVATRRKLDLVFEVAGGLVGRRKIGKAVSAKVGEIWGERDRAGGKE